MPKRFLFASPSFPPTTTTARTEGNTRLLRKIVIHMLFRRPRRRDSDEAWEVVDSQSVEAVPMIYEGTRCIVSSRMGRGTDRDLSDVDIQDVADADIVGTYLFEVDPHTRRSRRESFEKAIIFARRELLRETEKRGFNMLLHER